MNERPNSKVQWVWRGMEKFEWITEIIMSNYIFYIFMIILCKYVIFISYRIDSHSLSQKVFHFFHIFTERTENEKYENILWNIMKENIKIMIVSVICIIFWIFMYVWMMWMI